MKIKLLTLHICHLTVIFTRCMFFADKMAFHGHDTPSKFCPDWYQREERDVIYISLYLYYNITIIIIPFCKRFFHSKTHPINCFLNESFKNIFLSIIDNDPWATINIHINFNYLSLEVGYHFKVGTSKLYFGITF